MHYQRDRRGGDMAAPARREDLVQLELTPRVSKGAAEALEAEAKRLGSSVYAVVCEALEREGARLAKRKR